MKDANPPNPRRPTIKEVAAHASVSISTVSLVMNGKGYVSPEMRVRVQAAVDHLGYIPRPAARALPSHRTGNIGFVLRDDHFRRTEPFYTGIYLGTEFEANIRSLYVLLTTVPKNYVSGEHTPRFLKELNVDGILVAGKVNAAFIEEATQSGLPVVLIDYEYEALPAAVIDNIGGAKVAVRHLIERGHTSLAFLGADMTHPSLSARREGFMLACAEAGIPPKQLQFFEMSDGNSDYRNGKKLAKKLLSSTERPTAVFCINDATARSVVDYALRLGLRIPEDLAVVGFDDVPQAEQYHPALTTVRVRTEQLGEVAMRYLVELIDAPPSRGISSPLIPHRITIPSELVIRETT